MDNKTAKELLRRVIEIDGGFLTSERLNGLAQNDDEHRLLQRLLSTGYMEIHTRNQLAGRAGQIELQYYRVSEKGYSFLNPIYKRIWDFVKGDLRTVTVAVITAVIITLATSLLVS